MRTGDGNESDKAVFGKILSNFKKQIKLDSIMVCDSALYSQENIQLISNLKWITRVPVTLKKTILKLRKKLETTEFDTVTQAQNYLKSINKKLKLWHLESLEIKENFLNKQSKFYHHQIETKPRVSEIERRTVAAGRFILATNIESSSDFHCSEILWNYKTHIPHNKYTTRV